GLANFPRRRVVGQCCPRPASARQRGPVSPAVVDFQSTLNGTRIGAGSVGGVRLFTANSEYATRAPAPTSGETRSPGGCAKIRVTGERASRAQVCPELPHLSDGAWPIVPRN